MANITGKIVNSSQAVVYCTFFNNQRERTIILLHGNSSSSGFWEPLIESSLAQQFNFFTFDLPGHGHSPIPENPEETYSFPGYANLLLELVEIYGLKDYVLFGHSLGGHIVLESLERLSKCQAAFIMGTPPFTYPPYLEKAFHMSQQFINFMQSGTDREIMQSTFNSMLPAEKQKAADKLFADFFSTDPQARELLTRSIYQGKFVDETKVLLNTKVPVYVIKAEGDQMVNPAYFEEFLPTVQILTVTDAGHYAPMEKPEAFAKIIMERIPSLEFKGHA